MLNNYMSYSSPFNLEIIVKISIIIIVGYEFITNSTYCLYNVLQCKHNPFYMMYFNVFKNKVRRDKGAKEDWLPISS